MTPASRFAVAITACLLAAACSRRTERAATSGAPDHDHPPGTPAHDHDHAPGVAHADHDPKHGGVFFMAANGFHHLEGTYADDGTFRVHLYDDFTRPILPTGFTGRVQVADRDETSVALVPDAGTGTLVGRLAPAVPQPVDLQLWLTFPGEAEESLFDMSFPPPAPTPHEHSAVAHAHGSPHGGLVVEAGPDHHLELARRDGSLELWVLDAHERAVPIEGLRPTLLVQDPTGASATVALAPAGDHFTGSTSIAPDQPLTAVATIELAGAMRTSRFAMPGKVPPPHAFASIMEPYERVRLALAGDSVTGIATAGADVARQAEALADADGASLGVADDEVEQVRALLPRVVTAARELERATDLSAARAAFHALTQPLLDWRKLVDGARPAVAYCPMADKSWLQPDGEIANPFYGSSMLRCGSITER